MAQEPHLPLEIKAHILQFVDQKSRSRLAMTSRFWRDTVEEYYNGTFRICGGKIARLLAQDIQLQKLNTRLKYLLKRAAPQFTEENKKIRDLLTHPALMKDTKDVDIIDPQFKLEHCGLFYPFTKEADNLAIDMMIGVLPKDQLSEFQRPRSGTITPAQTEGKQHTVNLKTPPIANHDPFAEIKSALLMKACQFGNDDLFLHLLKHRAIPRIEHLNLAAKGCNSSILVKILMTVKPEEATLYFATLTGQYGITNYILRKNLSLRAVFLTEKFQLAAIESKEPKLITYLRDLVSQYGHKLAK